MSDLYPAKRIEMGLRVRMLEDDNEFQDLVLTVHHCFMQAIMNTAAFKMIENHEGVAFVRQQTEPINR